MKTLRLVVLFVVLLVSICQIEAKIVDVGVPTVASTSGTTGTNAIGVVMIFSSSFQGTINGVSVTSLAGGTLSFDAETGNTLASITYTVTAGTITIFKIQ